MKLSIVEGLGYVYHTFVRLGQIQNIGAFHFREHKASLLDCSVSVLLPYIFGLIIEFFIEIEWKNRGV